MPRSGLSAIAEKTQITALWLFNIGSNNWTFGNDVIFDSVSYTSRVVFEDFTGIEESNTKYGDKLIPPNKTSFSITGEKTDFSPPSFIGEEVLITSVIDGVEAFAWRFYVKSCYYSYGKFHFTCEDFLQPYLFNNYFPNTELLNNFNDTTAIFEGSENACIPEVFGTAYIPLRMIPQSNEWFPVLGVATGTYTIDKIASPLELDRKSVYEPPTYNFTQSTISGLRVFANDIGSTGNNVPFGISGKLLDTPTQFSNSLTETITNPADIISYILQKLGVPLAYIDTTGTFATTKALLQAENIEYNYAFTTKEDALKTLCELLQSCNCIMPRSDVVQLILLEDTAVVKTIDRNNILDLSFSEYEYTDDFDAGTAQYYTDIQDGEPSELPIAINGVSYTNISADKVLYKYISDTVIIQKLSIIDYRRKYLRTGTVSFGSDHSMIDVYLGDRLTISDDLYEDYENVYIDTIKISPFFELSFSLEAFSETIGDLSDYNPSEVIKAEDESPVINPLSDRWLKVIYQRAATQPETPTGDEPAGWYDTIPAGSDVLWESQAWFGNDNTLLDGAVWSTPIQKEGIGTPGPQGDTGPGLVFTGEYSPTKPYYKTATIQNVVLDTLTSTYYACLASNTGESLSNPLYWQALASFESVATDILLAVDATILKNLNIGWRTGDGYLADCSLRSGMSDPNTGVGFFLGTVASETIISFKGGASSGLYIDSSGSTFTGSLTIQSGSTGVANLSDAGNLATQDRNDLDYTDGADPTALNTAAFISGQGTLATSNSADWQTQVLGTGKPSDNADVTETIIQGGLITTGRIYNHATTPTLDINFNTADINVGTGANLNINTTEGIIVNSGGGMKINAGGDLTLNSTTSNKGEIIFQNGGFDVGRIYCEDVTGEVGSMSLLADSATGDKTLKLGSSSNIWASVRSYSRSLILDTVNSAGTSQGLITTGVFTGENGRRSTMLSTFTGQDESKIDCFAGESASYDSYLNLKVGSHSVKMVNGVEVHTGLTKMATTATTYDSLIPNEGDHFYFINNNNTGEIWGRRRHYNGIVYPARVL